MKGCFMPFCKDGRFINLVSITTMAIRQMIQLILKRVTRSIIKHLL